MLTSACQVNDEFTLRASRRTPAIGFLGGIALHLKTTKGGNMGKILLAKGVSGSTLLGVNTNSFPVQSGNCFSVYTEGSRYRIVNFSLENWNEMIKKYIKLPIKILTLNEDYAIIHDERIPHKWYDDYWCEICCPHEFLPITQKFRLEREEWSGYREVFDGYVSITPSKRVEFKIEEL